MIRVAALAAALAGLPAVEVVLRDITLDVAQPPTDFDFTITANGQSRSGGDAFASALRIAPALAWSFAGTGQAHGPWAQASLPIERATFDGGGDWTSYGLGLGGGWAWAATDRLTLTAAARAHLCQVDAALTGSFPRLALSGDGLGYGVDLGGRWCFSDAWIAGLSVGYESTAVSVSGSGATLDIDRQGVVVALTVGWRFSAAPSRVE
jgi:hypothetical protein